MTDREVLGLIPARGGSKGIPEKNITDLAGKPLIQYTIDAANDASVIDTVIVSTDDDDIATISRECGARVPFKRPKRLATDEASTNPVVQHALNELESQGEVFDDVVLLQPTSPLRTAAEVEEAYEWYASERAESLISVYPTVEKRWQSTPNGAEKLNYQDASNRRQDRRPEYVENGAIYIIDEGAYRETGAITVGKTVMYEMNKIDSIDIDIPYDLWLAEQILIDWNKTLNNDRD